MFGYVDCEMPVGITFAVSSDGKVLKNINVWIGQIKEAILGTGVVDVAPNFVKSRPSDNIAATWHLFMSPPCATFVYCAKNVPDGHSPLELLHADFTVGDDLAGFRVFLLTVSIR